MIRNGHMGFAYSRETYCLTVQVSSLLAQVSLCPRSEFCHPFFVETWLRRSRSTGKTSSWRVLWSSSPSISRNGGRDGSLAIEVSMSFFPVNKLTKIVLIRLQPFIESQRWYQVHSHSAVLLQLQDSGRNMQSYRILDMWRIMFIPIIQV